MGENTRSDQLSKVTLQHLVQGAVEEGHVKLTDVAVSLSVDARGVSLHAFACGSPRGHADYLIDWGDFLRPKEEILDEIINGLVDGLKGNLGIE